MRAQVSPRARLLRRRRKESRSSRTEAPEKHAETRSFGARGVEGAEREDARGSFSKSQESMVLCREKLPKKASRMKGFVLIRCSWYHFFRSFWVDSRRVICRSLVRSFSAVLLNNDMG